MTPDVGTTRDAALAHRRLWHWTIALTAVSLAGPIACVDNEASITITRAVPRNPASETCAAVLDDTVFQTRGVVDIVMANDYVLFVEMRNAMPEISEVKGFTGGDVRLNTSDVMIQRATISFEPLAPLNVNFPDPLRQRISGSVAANGGFAVLPVELLTPSMMDELRNAEQFLTIGANGEVLPVRNSVTILVKLEIAGETLDKVTVKTNQFEFPLTICSGCLSSPPAFNQLDSTLGEFNCLDVGASTTTQLDSPACGSFVGMDYAVDCRTCSLFATDPIVKSLCQPPGL